jgi:hypothetical protein
VLLELVLELVQVLTNSSTTIMAASPPVAQIGLFNAATSRSGLRVVARLDPQRTGRDRLDRSEVANLVCGLGGDEVGESP